MALTIPCLMTFIFVARLFCPKLRAVLERLFDDLLGDAGAYDAMITA